MLTFLLILYNIFETNKDISFDLEEQEGLNTGLIVLLADVVLVILFKVCLEILRVIYG